MKKITCFMLACSLVIPYLVLAQSNNNACRMPIAIVMTDECGPQEAGKVLNAKLEAILLNNGFVVSNQMQRFVLTAKINIVSKDVLPTNPPKVSQKLEVILFIGDVLSDRLYGSYSFAVSGIGQNETKAFITAFQSIKTNSEGTVQMLTDVMRRICSYYDENTDELLEQTKSLSSVGRYDEAIAELMAVPEACDRYNECQEAAIEIYKMKMNADAVSQLAKAKDVWNRSRDASGAAIAAEYLQEIPPQSSYYLDAEQLRKEILQKLSSDEQREIAEKFREYEDNQNFRNSIVQACREIGVAWANNQPQSIVKSKIMRW